MKKIAATLAILSALLLSSTAHAQSLALNTETSKEIGLSFASYQYKEPGLMSLKGAMFGVEMQGTQAVANERFVRGEVRYAFGLVDYDSNGTGSASDNQNLYMEVRVLAGADYAMRDIVFAPYIGAGYRYLYHDGRGMTNTGFFGYRRESNYFYVPIGFHHRSRINGQARLAIMAEYDLFLAGTQTSKLSDVDPRNSDFTNDQTSGYGLKFSVMYTQSKWAIGPYAHYWNIAESNVVPATVMVDGIPTRGRFIEPANNTVEMGIKASQKF